MANLVVVGFKNDRFKAAKVLNKLRQMNKEWTARLHDAIAVYRGFNGELRVDQSYETTKRDGAMWGAIWGSVIGSIMAMFTVGLAAPAVVATAIGVGLAGGGVLGAATGAIAAVLSKEDFRLSQDQQVAFPLQPGDSAIFAALYADEPEEVIGQFEGDGGKVLVTSLSDEQKAWIEGVVNKGRN